MTSSGTYNFALSNGECVLAAYSRIRVRPTMLIQTHMVDARNELNLLFVEFSNRQVNLFSVVQSSIPMVSGQATYTIPAQTIMILDAWITTNPNTSAAADRYITPMSRTVFASLANKSTQGAPTQYWFDRLIAPTITMWPVPDLSATYQLNYFSCIQFEDAGLPGAETPSVPYRWLDVLVAGLAHRLSRIYAPDLTQARKMDYDEAWKVAASQDTENVNWSITPMLGTYYR